MAIQKARYWCGVLYPENMVDNWQAAIDDTLQLPFAYCLHDKSKDSKSEHRKTHIHLIVVFPNTTTYKHALTVFSLLSANGRNALNKIQAIINIRNMFDYLIHDTDSCRKAGKELYKPSQRICGNNFDIGAFEQLGVAEKNDISRTLANDIIQNGFTNFTEFYTYVLATYEDSNYFEILKNNSGFFERLTKGNFQKIEFRKKFDDDSE